VVVDAEDGQKHTKEISETNVKFCMVWLFYTNISPNNGTKEMLSIHFTSIYGSN
jgi:hypothetical protein